MLKKFEKIIKGVFNPTKEQTAKAQFSNETGFYYITDGYRCVRFAENINDLPVYTEKENTYNVPREYSLANEVEYKALEIPYSIKQIKEWKKANKNKPFKLGVTANRQWIGINAKYLIDAMETTGSNTLLIPKRGYVMLMQGNEIDWLIMPVALQGFERDKTMTEI